VTIALAVLLGAAAGILSGLFGIGGGIVIVPFLVFALRMETVRAVGTSLAALLLPVGIFAVLRYAKDGNVDFGVAIAIAIALAAFAPVGAEIASRLGSDNLGRAFGVLLVVLGVRFVVR
jgi:uncharacterized membrane protein YfcA